MKVENGSTVRSSENIKVSNFEKILIGTWSSAPMYLFTTKYRKYTFEQNIK